MAHNEEEGREWEGTHLRYGGSHDGTSSNSEEGKDELETHGS